MADSGSEAVRSPYEHALAASLHDLHPRLRAYFGVIPAGSAGIGSGVFETVGTPKRWLRPLLRLFSGEQIMFPVWSRDVPFTIVIAGLTMRIPNRLAPVVTLHERWDERTAEQHVSVVVDAPVLGRLYEYAGCFTYAIRPGEAAR